MEATSGRNPTNQSHQRNNGDWNARENSDACYECGRTGHIKKYCPQLKNKTANSNSRDFKEKKFKSRKALLTWDDSDESDKEGSEDEDVAQLCFMANDDDLKLQNEKELKLVKIRSDHGAILSTHASYGSRLPLTSPIETTPLGIELLTDTIKVYQLSDVEYSGNSTPKIIYLAEIHDRVYVPVSHKDGALLSHMEDIDAPEILKVLIMSAKVNDG
ncbi:hypothetical protein RJ640_007045 [Escallonia rubra]|uniref:CCHC-type domain-containing protein n=1 Tax=Escallonia rubra TaxID=112253 RepID=A0AA88RSJ9_9ASTE|nr:hypothetical protein RJ640_007045 [Escallonia rubra]